ncbi:DNRLRE domain-containing protein, partial [Bacteroidales bacterium OttesenSCG-928-M11]|nr:DNRLRE domain-containing protein [Bacteroidales bacterium OttesenSCG-928-M11]
YIGMGNPNSSCLLTDGGNLSAINANGTTSNPRAWRFVSVEEVDAFYPEVSDAGATTSDIKWYHIKSLDSEITGEEKYLSIDPETKKFSLAEKADNENQLFGFVYGGFASHTAYTQIISKATGEYIYLDASNLLATSAEAKNITMRHVYAPNSTETMQLNFRTQRSAGGRILTNNFEAEQPTWAKTYGTNDNKYAWKVETTTSYAINTTAGSGVTIVSSPTEASFGESVAITYTLENANNVPEVTVNGEAYEAGLLSEGVYTLLVEVTGEMTIHIEAKSPQNYVTVNAGTGIVIVSPDLDDDNKFPVNETATVVFTLEDGYETPTVTATNATVADPVLSGNNYSVAISEIKENAAITLAASLKNLTVTLDKSEGIAWSGEPATTVAYGSDYSFSFSIENGYGKPIVIVNGDVVEPALASDVYTVTVEAVTAELTIYVAAFGSNVIPVVADTYVNGGSADSNFSTNSNLLVQYSYLANYTRRAYLDFDVAAIRAKLAEGDARILLTVATGTLQQKTGNPLVEARSAESTMDVEIKDMTWNLNEEVHETPHGNAISENVTFDVTTPLGTKIDFDITDYILENIDKVTTDNIRIQIVGLSGQYDGNINFYSIEGALAENNIDLIPVLSFEEPVNTVTVTVSADENVTVVYPEAAGPYEIEEGESFTLVFSVATGYELNKVTINGTDATGDELKDEGGAYTLTLASVAEDTAIEISTKEIFDSINDLKDQGVLVSAEGNRLTITTKDSQDVEIITVAGQLINKVSVNGYYSTTLPNGIYLVKVGTQVLKVRL